MSAHGLYYLRAGADVSRYRRPRWRGAQSGARGKCDRCALEMVTCAVVAVAGRRSAAGPRPRASPGRRGGRRDRPRLGRWRSVSHRSPVSAIFRSHPAPSAGRTDPARHSLVLRCPSSSPVSRAGLAPPAAGLAARVRGPAWRPRV